MAGITTDVWCYVLPLSPLLAGIFIMTDLRYQDGSYLAENPTWHAEDAPWKLEHVLRGLVNAGINFQTVVDRGCGSGALIKLWASRCPQLKFTGYDISPQALLLCQQNKPENVSFVLQKAPPQYKADVLLIMDVLEHVEDEENWLRESAACANFLVLHIPLERSLHSRLRPSWIEEQRQRVGHIHFYTPRDVELLLARNGLQILSWHYTNKYVECPQRLSSCKSKVGMCIRKLAHWLLPRRFSAVTIGGYSVLCVAQVKQDTSCATI